MTEIFNKVDPFYINQETRAIFMNFSFYNPSSDQFVVVEFLVEFMISGIVVPTYMRILPFSPNIFELEDEKTMAALDVFRLLITFYIIF
jgi:hypothetical protein